MIEGALGRQLRRQGQAGTRAQIWNSPEGKPVWLSPPWLGGLAIAIIVGILRQAPLLTGAGLLGLTLTGAQLLWLRFCLHGVTYERRLGATRAFWGDKVSLAVRVGNHKPLPLSWLVAEDRLPERLPVDGSGIVDDAHAHLRLLKLLPAMLPYGRVLRQATIRCEHRGAYQFGPVHLASGDILGQTTRDALVPSIDQLLVYPKLFELDMEAPESRRMIGPRSVDRVILTDPSRTLGVRGYRPGDPLRYVEWRATARRQDLLVRLFEPTTDPAAAIFINSDPPTPEWGYYDPPELEFCISLAASISRWLLQRGHPVGLFGNGEPAGEQAVRVPLSSQPDQLQRILETLALASPFGPVNRPLKSEVQRADRLDGGPRWRLPLGQLLLREAAHLPFETSIIVVTARFDVDQLAACRELQRRRPITIYYVQTEGQPLHPNLSGLRVITIPYPQDWTGLERLQLAA
ncbi:MAG: DUF58 domain-containing protein [Chloroflexi bacterium]|nr:DUF58 domain-containing protein [Chloroflexota bacterium]